MKTAFDAAYPPSTVPGTATTACIYAGGDTPNPIADPRTVSVYGQVRYWLPLWVRSDPTPTLGATDAAGMVAWLRRNGAPAGTATALDIETAVTPAYVNAYGGFMHAAGYKVLVYGSRSTLFRNPALDGYFSAHPGATSLDPACVATQYLYAASYDLSWITDAVVLWDRHPPARATTPPTSTPAQAKRTTVVTLKTIHGHGWLPLPAATWSRIYVCGPNPDVVGSYGVVPTVAYVSLTPGPHSPYGVVVFVGPDGTWSVILD